MTLKSTYSLLSFAIVCAGSPALAQTVNFTITGTIDDVACTPNLTGAAVSGSTVTLPNVKLTDLDTAGKTAGNTPITFTLANCGMSTATNNMWVHFNSGNVVGGRMVTSNSQVHVEIRNDSASGNLVQAGGTAANQPTANQGTAAPFTGTFPNRGASKTYVLRYYASQPVTQAGTVSTQATYTVKYY